MKTKFIFGILAVASFSFTACSNDDIPEEIITPNPDEEVQPESAVKELGVFNFSVNTGVNNGHGATSRTPGDVDDLYRPINKYRLGGVNMLKLTPTTQPKANDIDLLTKVEYSNDVKNGKYAMQSHEFNNGVYKLYYQLKDIVKDDNKLVSDKGKIRLADNKEMNNYLEFDLSLFKVEDLTNENKIQLKLNEFAYEIPEEYGETNVRGSSLRYTSYNPTNPADYAIEQGKYAQLPIVEDASLKFLKGDRKNNNTLVEEHKDDLFVGNEFLIGAYDNKVYLYEVIPVEAESGGFWLRRTYENKFTPNEANPDMLAFNRLTSIVNASFMFVVEESDKKEYFVEGDDDKTIANFKEQYGLDLNTLQCPYATIDGINREYYINDIQTGFPNTTKQSRLILWRDQHETKDVTDTPWNKTGLKSGDIVFNYGNKEKRGYGIKGNSYSVIFPGTAEDTKGKDINFWTTVDGVNVKLSIAINTEIGGIAFSQNVAHQLVVFIPAQKFTDKVKELKKNNTKTTRSSSDNDYAELRLSSDCIAFK